MSSVVPELVLAQEADGTTTISYTTRSELGLMRIDATGYRSAYLVYRGQAPLSKLAVLSTYPVRAGALVVLSDVATYAGQAGRYKGMVVLVDKDGVAHARGPTPAELYRCGRITALDANTLLCPVYKDGAYRLLRSRDLGKSWQKHTVVTHDAPAPDNAGFGLNDFGIVTVLRRDGKASPRYPMAPWAADNRYKESNGA